MIDIFPLCALKDNYIWVIKDAKSSKVAVVDPGEAKPVLDCLAKNNLELSCILVTHHHWDHTNGIPKLVAEYPVPIYGPGPGGLELFEGQEISLPFQNTNLKVMHIPGHTLDHVAYYNDKIVFTGDTLFSAGCGRVFEGTQQQMFDSLNKLKTLPKTIKIYCGHEYTVNNLEFAMTVEPDNKNMQKRLSAATELRKDNQPTLPCTLQDELDTNPFMRALDFAEFSKRRMQKDNF